MAIHHLEPFQKILRSDTLTDSPATEQQEMATIEARQSAQSKMPQSIYGNFNGLFDVFDEAELSSASSDFFGELLQTSWMAAEQDYKHTLSGSTTAATQQNYSPGPPMVRFVQHIFTK